MQSDKIAEERFKIALQARSQEIELFWKRSLFFWGFIASAFVGYASSAEKGGVVPLALACFGLICSLAWTLANRGSKYWQENWEAKVHASEEEIVGELFRRQEPRQKKGPFSAVRYSVSRLAIGLSDFTTGIWATLLARQGFVAFGLSPTPGLGTRSLFLASAGVTFAYAAFMVWAARTGLSEGNAVREAHPAAVVEAQREMPALSVSTLPSVDGQGKSVTIAPD